MKSRKNSARTPVRSKDNFLVFGEPRIGEPEIEDVVACLRSAWIGTGPRVARFEHEFATYKRVTHAAAVSSCSAALHLSLLAANLEQGAEVITTPLTFCATVNAIIHAGAKPVLADIEPGTLNIDPKEIEKRITGRTRALVPVHFAGRPCSMHEIMRIAERHNLKVIEDCAHAVEAEYHGELCGTQGDFGCFSFYSTKNLVTGEGGMIVARRQQDIDRIKILALHGMDKDAWKRFGDEGFKHYEVVACGFKYNMMDLQAAIGLPQLARIEDGWLRRHEVWTRYQESFRDLPLTLPDEPELGTRHAHHLYTVLVDEEVAGITRDEFLDRMTYHGIGVGVHYLSIAEHPYYQNRFGWAPADYQHAMRVGRQTVSLPLSAKLSDRDVDDVIEAVSSIVGMG